MKPITPTFKAIAFAAVLPLAAFGQTSSSDNGPTDSAHVVTGSATGTSTPVMPVGSAINAQGTGESHTSTGATTVTGTTNGQ